MLTEPIKHSVRPEWTQHRERGSLTMLRVMTFISLKLGRPLAWVVLYGIAAYFFAFAPRARRDMRDYLRRALGREPSAWDRYRLILSFAATINDRLFLLSERYEIFNISLEGEDVVRECLASGQGAFLMGAHMGSFEVTRAVGLRQPGLRVSMAM